MLAYRREKEKDSGKLLKVTGCQDGIWHSFFGLRLQDQQGIIVGCRQFPRLYQNPDMHTPRVGHYVWDLGRLQYLQLPSGLHAHGKRACRHRYPTKSRLPASIAFALSATDGGLQASCRYKFRDSWEFLSWLLEPRLVTLLGHRHG